MLKLKEKYQKAVLPELKKKFGYKNDLATPRITKVVVNTGFNPDKKDAKAQKEIADSLALITGQKPAPRQAKKAVAAFKTRKGMTVGMAATLRGQRMYSFLDELINVVLPRSRDFRGLLEKNIDQGGNLNIGVREQIVFPEISAESAKSIFGLEIAVVTTAQNREEGVELFKLLGFPIKS